MNFPAASGPYLADTVRVPLENTLPGLLEYFVSDFAMPPSCDAFKTIDLWMWIQTCLTMVPMQPDTSPKTSVSCPALKNHTTYLARQKMCFPNNQATCLNSLRKWNLSLNNKKHETTPENRNVFQFLTARKHLSMKSDT